MEDESKLDLLLKGVAVVVIACGLAYFLALYTNRDMVSGQPIETQKNPKK